MLEMVFLEMMKEIEADDESIFLTYKGGKVMTRPMTLSLLWFGNGWHKARQDALRTAIVSLSSDSNDAENSEVPTLSNWWEIVRQYRDGSGMPVTGSVSLGAECTYPGPHNNVTANQVTAVGRSLFDEEAIEAFGRNLSCTEVFDVSDDAIYLIIFSNRVMFSAAEEQQPMINGCSGDLGELEVVGGRKVKMIWTRVPLNGDDQCSSRIFDVDSDINSPKGDKMIDALVSYTLAKIAEEATNRDGQGWSSSSGQSVSSMCFYPSSRGTGDLPPPFFKDSRNGSFNVIGRSGYMYMVQQLWDQQIRNCAVKLSEKCGIDAVVITQPKGYLSSGISVNHTTGLQPYPPSQRCRWKIHYSSAKFFTFHPSYVSTEGDDLLRVCKSGSLPVDCINIGKKDQSKRFRLTSSAVYVEFTTAAEVSPMSRGWELSYSAGFCDGKEHVYDRNGVIGYPLQDGSPYIEGINCQWVLHGKPGTPVSLTFTSLNTSKDLDFLAIYNESQHKTNSLDFNFSGLFLGSDLPQINLTGKVMIAFATQTDQGTGWSARFYISSPASRPMSPLLIAIIVAAAILILFSVVLIISLFMRKKIMERNQSTSTHEKLKLLEVVVDREENWVGEGPSAIIYKAKLENGHTVAVKAHRERNARVGLEEEILLKTSFHPNIICLLGYAQDGLMGRKLLVFEYMGRGSLRWNLKERGEFLSWEKRLDIALQVSSALQLLHMYSKPPIIHGNLRSENVLLDDSWNAKLGGFGNANFCTNSGFDQGNQLEMVEDVSNFGLMLVELLRGVTVVRRSFAGLYKLVEDQERLDPRLEIPMEETKMKGLAKLGEIAKWCIGGLRERQDNTSPTMGDVALGLKQVKQLFLSAMG
ncbi:hypothetical protein ACLOJK_024685 [Asimina triloba]